MLFSKTASFIRLATFIVALAATFHVRADYGMEWGASTLINASTSRLAPYYISARSGGYPVSGSGIYESAFIAHRPDSAKRFSLSYGLEGVAGVQFHKAAPSKAKTWIQQLWVEARYRSLFLTAGMKADDRSLFNSPLGIGDFVISDNARPIPQISIGFIDFQPIPFTRRAVWIRGDIAYGKFADAGWLEDHFNYYDSFITTGVWFHSKSLHLASNPDWPLAGILGFRHASQFGGTRREYAQGKLISTMKCKARFRDFVDVFFQTLGNSGYTEGDRAFINGNHLGSWDLQLHYRLRNGDRIVASAQLPWEDGSAIGKLNGWDGIWALRWEAGNTERWINAVEITYLDFMNQSGPLHWAPADHPGTQIPGAATGADDYYNNAFYDGWSNYGMSIGTPFVKSPAYNSNGYLRFTDNRMRGVQLGAQGNFFNALQWRLLLSWRMAAGTPLIPSDCKREVWSCGVMTHIPIKSVPGLHISAAAAFDAGSLYQAGFGLKAAVVYKGSFFFKSRSR